MSDEQIVLINDLLSFISCKSKNYSKNNLIGVVHNFYPENAIIEAEKALSMAINPKDCGAFGESCHSDSLAFIFTCLESIPKDRLPLFLCKDINNIPSLEGYSESEPLSKLTEITINAGESCSSRTEPKNDVSRIKDEQEELKLQIKKISSSVNQLENVLQFLVRKSSPLKDRGKCQLARTGPSEEDPIAELQDSHEPSSSRERMQEGVEFIQHLIDEQATTEASKQEGEAEDHSDSDTDEFDVLDHYSGDISTNRRVKNSKKTPSDVCPEARKGRGGRRGRKRKASASYDELRLAEQSINISTDRVSGAVFEIKKSPKPPELHQEATTSDASANPHQCPFPNCKFSSRHKSWLKVHMRKHTGEKPFCCPYCPFRSSQNGNITVHIKNIHESEVSFGGSSLRGQRYHCPYCRSRYWQKSNLSVHILKAHSNYKNTGHLSDEDIANLCLDFMEVLPEQNTKMDEILTPPIESQVASSTPGEKEEDPPENLFKCWFPLCNFSARHKSWLTVHLRKHTGEKPFACPYCPFRASQGGNLNSHVKNMHLHVVFAEMS